MPCTFSTKHDHNLLSLYTRRWHSDTPGEQRNRFRPAEGASDAQKDGGLLVVLPSPSGTLERFSKFPKALCVSLYLRTPRNFCLPNSGWGHFKDSCRVARCTNLCMRWAEVQAQPKTQIVVQLQVLREEIKQAKTNVELLEVPRDVRLTQPNLNRPLQQARPSSRPP